MAARNWAGAVGLAVGVALFVLLFTQLGFNLSDLLQLMSETPVWLVLCVTALTLCVQVIGALRWRLVTRWLAPEQDVPEVRRAVTATSWGSFFGQFLPVQLAMPAARWMSSRKGSAVGSTLYEGLFDFVILASGAVAAALVILAQFDPLVALGIFAFAILCGCLFLRPSLGLMRVLLAYWCKRNWIGSERLEALDAPIKRIGNAPGSLMSSLAVWSILKLVVLSARLLMIALAFASPINSAMVAIGYPIVGLTLGVPFLPAGLGLADWSWTGVLMLAGAAASVAGLTAVAARALNFVALALIVGAVMPLWTVTERFAARTSSSQPAVS